MAASRIIAVSGGIGSGKSIVCHILTCMGYPVYDCDSRAKCIMDTSVQMRRIIAEKIDPRAIDGNGCIDRRRLAATVFADASKLRLLNSLVHTGVLEDIRCWLQLHDGPAFIETAILYQSGLNKMVGEVWEVTAPEPVRIHRVMQRNNMMENEVQARIEAQRYVPSQKDLHWCSKTIVNDGVLPVLPQVRDLLDSL